MAVSTARYRPTLIDEHLDMRDVDNDGDLDATLCRAAATAMALDAMTNGEWTRTAQGNRWGRARIKTLLKRMRAATGEPDRAGYNQSHTPAFVKGAGFPTGIITVFNKPMADVKAKLKAGFTVTLAGDVAGTPARSPLRRYVNPGVGHEIILTRLNGKGDKAYFIDPMTPHGTSIYERSAPWSHFVGFSKRFATAGNVIAEIWKRGRLTEAKEVARDRARVILKLQQDLLALQKVWEEQQRELIVQDEQLEKFRAQISTLKAKRDALQAELDECNQLGQHDHMAEVSSIEQASAILAQVIEDLK